jgi:hypothetical protein
MRRTLSTLLLCAGALLAPSAFAGRSCDAEYPPKASTVERGLTLAERTLAALDASGDRVVILARAGQDLSKYGLRYSHLGFAYKQPDGQGGHVWRVMHKLNQCGSADAYVYRQGLGEFFIDDLWRYEATWVSPTPEVQERLLALLQDPKNQARATQLNIKAYSMVSYAWGTKYQQSNQWALETLALAMEPSVTSRDRAQAWLKFKAYEPTVLTIRPLTRLGGRATRANVAFDDHPNDKRFSDHIETVTVDSVFDWLQRAQLGKAPIKLAL